MNAFSAWRGGSSAQRTKQRNGSRVALVPVLEPPPASVADATTTRSEAQEDLGELTCKFNVRQFTPRHMAELSLELYVLGYIDWDEYAMLAFQSELHPDFDRTIGALTGEKADPDRPRDFLAWWEERLAFERTYNPDDRRLLDRTLRIVNLFRKMDAPTRLVA